MKFELIHHPVRWVFLFHAIGGLIALIAFSIPLMSRKGGKLHVRTGWIYVGAMTFVGLSALMITPWRVFFDDARTSSSAGFAVFLAFISVFTFAAIWHGIRAIKEKGRAAPSRSIVHLGLPFLVIVFGLGTQITGIVLRYPLLIIFPFLGHLVSFGQIKYWATAPATKMHWWFAHMDGMIVACIATLTAFIVTAVPRIWSNPFTESPFLWIAPGIILGQISKKWKRSYRVKFGV